MTDLPNTLVTDFDGTLTRRDFYRILIDEHIGPDGEIPWRDFRAGRITHFEALRRVYAMAPLGEDGLDRVARSMGLQDGLPDLIGRLNGAGWRVIVASAGCHWYIDRLMKSAGVAIEVNANPGEVADDGSLAMHLPTDSPYFSPEIGIDKPGVVRAALERGGLVAFSGDGLPDLAPGRLVPEARRFARGMMAEEMTRLGEAFRPFERWSEVAEALIAG